VKIQEFGLHPVNEQALPLKLGLIGFVLAECEGVLSFHNPLLNRSLISFWLFGNWVCIGFVLALIGFVLALFSPSFQLAIFS